MVRHGSAWNILFILFLYSTSSMLFARPVSVEQARKVADTFLKAQNIRHEKKLKLLRMRAAQRTSQKKFTAAGVKEVRGEDDKVLAYVTELEPGGFIITAADDSIRPILGYSFKGKFPFEDTKQNVLLHLVQWDVEARLKTLNSDNLEITNLAQANRSSRNTYTSGNEEFVQALAGDSQQTWPENLYWCPNPNCGHRQANPGACEVCDETTEEKGWITSAWHQNFPYNKFCPSDPFCSVCKCPVGCAAVAVAQIINYWKYPPSIHFDDSKDSYVSHGWNRWQNQHYMFNIDNAADIYNFPNFTELNSQLSGIDYVGEVNELAYLCFGVGVKYKMQYSPHSSGTTVTDVYKDGFYYGSATHEYHPTGLPWQIEWRQPVIDNIKKGWPAQIGLVRSYTFPAMAHTVIADGYKLTGEFHINCGWGGQGDFWYSLPVVDTHDAPIPSTEYYDIVADVVYDICPYQGWYQYGADEKNSFYAIYAAPTADPPADKWQVEVPSNYHVTGLVVGTGNKIYTSLSPKDLNQGYSPEIWVINQYGDMGKVEKYYITSEDNRVEYPVQNSNGEVFVATGEGGVYKIDTQTKNMVKIFQEPSGNALGIPKIDSDNRLYVNTNNDDKLYCLDASGYELWPAPFDAPGSTKMYRGLPAIDIARNNVYIGYYDPSAEKSYLGCVNRLDGTLRYQKTFDNILHGSWMTGVASIGSDGTVFVGCYDKLYALVPTGNSFTEHWVQQFDSKMADAIAVGKDGTLYASYWKQVSSTWYYAFGALYPANGDSKWEITIPSPGDYDNILQPYVTANNVIVFSILREQPGQDTFETYAYRDMGDHAEQLWHKDWETDSGGDVAFGPGATLYVLPTGGSWGGTIYAISEGDSGDPDGAGMSYTNNAGPSIPSNSVPTDGEQGLGATVILSWDCSDPEGHDPNYSVFVGKSGYDMVPIAKDINENSYVLDGLKPNTGYAWKIIATDGQAVTEGPTWVFATKPPNPDLNGDGIVDLLDFAILAQCWVGSCSDPDWCEGRDLDWSGEVALSDLQILAEAWLTGIRIGEIRGPLSLDSGWPPQAETGPIWSPDGTKIVFSWGDGYTAWDPSFGTPNPDGSYIVTMTADGQAIRGPDNPLVNEVGWDNGHPDWSPDGEWVVYKKSRVGPAQILKVLVADSNVVMPITEITGDWHPRCPKWSPDGNNIAYLGGYWHSNYHIWLTDPNGDNHEDLTPDITGSVTGLSWSPDGTEIVFTQGDPNLFVLDLDTNDIMRLPGFQNDLVPTAPVWCSDGNSILFNASGNIYCYRIDTQGTAQLTAEPDSDWLGDWHPAAGIVFSSDRGCTVRWDSNIYVAETVR